MLPRKFWFVIDSPRERKKKHPEILVILSFRFESENLTPFDGYCYWMCIKSVCGWKEANRKKKKKTTQRNRYNKRSIAQNCAEKHSSVQFFFSFPFHFVSIQSTNYKHKPNKIKKSNSKAFATERKKEEKKNTTLHYYCMRLQFYLIVQKNLIDLVIFHFSPCIFVIQLCLFACMCSYLLFVLAFTLSHLILNKIS